MAVKLRLRSVSTRQEYVFEERVTLGRDMDASIPLTDQSASRHHAEIWPYGDHWILTDKGSTNGTYLNGARIPAEKPTAIKSGDTIRCGNFEFYCVFDKAPGVPQVPPIPQVPQIP